MFVVKSSDRENPVASGDIYDKRFLMNEAAESVGNLLKANKDGVVVIVGEDDHENHNPYYRVVVEAVRPFEGA